MDERLSLRHARRIALAVQGFAAARPAAVGAARMLGVTRRLGLHQIDSVNVLAPRHYLPLFSRLGAYERGAARRGGVGPRRDCSNIGRTRPSLLPVELHPLLRWRMERADRGEGTWQRVRAFAGERRGEAMALLERIRAEGPLAASDLRHEQARKGWWEWSDAKVALEWLFWAGHVTAATRRTSFERVYDVPERVLPPTSSPPGRPLRRRRSGGSSKSRRGRWACDGGLTFATISG
jgi:uncharacterized protein YcaQ